MAFVRTRKECQVPERAAESRSQKSGGELPVHTHQVTDFAPWRIPRAELDSQEVQKLVRVLKKTGRCPAGGGSPETRNSQTSLFPSKSRNLQEEAL